MNDPINRVDADGNQGTLVVQVWGQMPPPEPTPPDAAENSLGQLYGEPMLGIAQRLDMARQEREEMNIARRLNSAFSISMNRLLQNEDCAGVLGNLAGPELLGNLYSVTRREIQRDAACWVGRQRCCAGEPAASRID